MWLQVTDYFVFQHDKESVTWTVLDEDGGGGVTWVGNTNCINGCILMDVRWTSVLDMTVIKHASLQNLVQRAHLINVKGHGDVGVGGLDEILNIVNKIIRKGTPESEVFRDWMISSGLKEVEDGREVQLPDVPRLAFESRKQEKETVRLEEIEQRRKELEDAIRVGRGLEGAALAAAVAEEMDSDVGDEDAGDGGAVDGGADGAVGDGAVGDGAVGGGGADSVEQCCGNDWDVLKLKEKQDNKQGVFYLEWDDESYQVKVTDVNNIYRGPVVVAWANSPEARAPFGDVHHYKYKEFKQLARPGMLQQHWRWVEEIRSYNKRQFMINYEEEDGIHALKANVVRLDPNGHTVQIKYVVDQRTELMGIQSFFDRLVSGAAPMPQPKKRPASSANAYAKPGRKKRIRQ